MNDLDSLLPKYSDSLKASTFGPTLTPFPNSNLVTQRISIASPRYRAFLRCLQSFIYLYSTEIYELFEGFEQRLSVDYGAALVRSAKILKS